MRRTSRLRAREMDTGGLSGLTGTRRFFNRLAGARSIAALAVAWPLVLGAPALADVIPHPDADAMVTEPDLHLDPPDGHCLFDAATRSENRFDTGFKPGLKSGTVLLAFYVPCVALQAAEDGTAEWLPEWVAIEKNTVTFPSDDARRLGPHGAVRQLCEDAQSAQWGHLRSTNTDINAQVAEALTRLSLEKPVVFLGVIGEDDDACYLAALQLIFSPSGEQGRYLVVQAFMQAGDRWVTQSVRRAVPAVLPSEGPATPAEVYAASRRAARAFAEKNR